MSIFDEFSRDSFLTKKATNKQAGAARRTKRDVEIASEFAERKDAEVASDGGTRISVVPDHRGGLFAVDANESTREKNSGRNAFAEFGDERSARGKTSDAEFGSDMAGPSQYGTQTYSHAGVSFDKLSEDQAKICYSGLLAKSGADKVIGVYGFGSNQRWEDVSEVVMTKDATGAFTATIHIVHGKNVNFAFKDSAENWDNNSGLNYTFVN